MGMMKEAVKAYLETQGMKYREDDKDDVLILQFRGDNFSGLRFVAFFEDDRYVQFRSMGYANIPQNKFDVGLQALNHLNKEYRWAKFILDVEDGEVFVEADAILDIESAGSEFEEEIYRLVSIADDAYPVIQKAIWA